MLLSLEKNIMQRSLGSLAGMATSAFARDLCCYAASYLSQNYSGIYHQLFYLWWGTSENEAQYQELIDTMADTLKSSMPDRGAPLPENIILEDMDGYRVEFNLPGENNEAEQVIVRVSKGDNSETREIPFASFEKICRVLLFRYEFLSLRIL
ncbi:effector protein pipB2 [Salmonella enterica subsp. enterica]|uniref:Effector protein pipB2 n=1 Tax=Salmonella enterica I TaxID=59201 RepID=A0A379WNK0_SALET|nr:effector protein pipB2 [Salmonella enterica subsp. enterica]